MTATARALDKTPTCRKPPRFGEYEDLSHLVSAVWRTCKRFNRIWDGLDHLDDAGPEHKTGGMLREVERHELREALERADLTEEEFAKIVAERTTEKWVLRNLRVKLKFY